MERNKLKTIGIATYLAAIPIFLVLSFLLFIAFSKIIDWELFSFNLYTCMVLFLLSSLVCFLLSFGIKQMNNYLLAALVMILPDLISLIVSGDSIYVNIFSTMVKDDNYILLAYPISLLVSFFIISKNQKTSKKTI